MSIRDDLAGVIYGERAVSLRTGYVEVDWEFARDAADAVLAWLGQLDPDADPELIALHLRDTRAELERLRAALDSDGKREPGWTLHDEMCVTERLEAAIENQSAEIGRLREVRDAALAVHQQGYPWGAYVRWREDGDAVAAARLDEVAAASKRLAATLEAEMALLPSEPQPLTDAQRERFEAAAERGLAYVRAAQAEIQAKVDAKRLSLPGHYAGEQQPAAEMPERTDRRV